MHVQNRSIATLLVALVSGLFILTFAPKAFAATDDWYSKTSPLIAWEDDAKQALAYGTAYTKNTYLKNHTFYRDPRAGGDAVYTESSYSYKEPAGQYGEQWGYPNGEDQSARDSSGSWVDQYDADDYSHRRASQGRVYYKVCEDQNFSGDPCSRKPYSPFNL